ncbi:7-carboxy-7-deazaguanine synthase [Pseudomonas matsuisoli]|uniref:7-carboxy-7-deazaguanine synthase n=1 Tax=Pseudomonas matsuisoli TaxID=1515666 RepID=A0A917Q1B3_9PSED|nr:7-carboxy-7-deazaguanine synthase [Pseudomonas matsuisoli]GGK05124.1 7-carboxy-7-deazaguanine synthase [Pseudomonas matsuisoli]
MTYSVKEMFYTLQGEGNQAGRPAVFCRFAGCNLWSGREDDRQKAICQFCDTDFVGTDGEGGGKFKTADALAEAIERTWPEGDAAYRYVVLTGGEPLLQVDEALVAALHARRFTIAVETNGTVEPPPGIDWICVSPKSIAEVVLTRGDELKLVYPQRDAMPERFVGLDFAHFYLQPMDGPEASRNTTMAIEYCKANPQWRLGLQQHKILMIP